MNPSNELSFQINDILLEHRHGKLQRLVELNVANRGSVKVMMQVGTTASGIKVSGHLTQLPFGTDWIGRLF